MLRLHLSSPEAGEICLCGGSGLYGGFAVPFLQIVRACMAQGASPGLSFGLSFGSVGFASRP